MKKLLSIGLFLLFVFQATAQRQLEMGVSLGPTNYFGDLGNEKIFPLHSTRYGGAISFRNFLNDPMRSGVLNPAFTMETKFTWHRIGYDETSPIANYKGEELRNYGRGLGFRSDVIGASTNLVLTSYRNKFIPLHRQTFAFFAYFGVGVFYANPKADLFRGDIDINNRYFFWSDGTIRDIDETSGKGKGNIIQKDGKFETELRDWFTEGQGAVTEFGKGSTYNLWNLSFPFGVGLRYGINKHLTVSTEISVYNFTTDFLDDVSNAYATYDEIRATYSDPVKQELAIYISDPTGKGTNGTPGPATSPRGNPQKNDMFTYIGFELSYKLFGKTTNTYLKK